MKLPFDSEYAMPAGELRNETPVYLIKKKMRVKASKYFIIGNGIKEMGIFFSSIKKALEGGRQSKYGHVYRTWSITLDGVLMDEEKELVHAFGKTVCTVQRADEILKDRIIEKYGTEDITYSKISRL